MLKILFICSQNKLRSPTAEAVFSDYPNVQARSAGLNHYAEVPLGAEDVIWADIIFVMESQHRNKLRQAFKKQLTHQRVICLGIPDHFDYMDPELIKILKKSVTPFLA